MQEVDCLRPCDGFVRSPESCTFSVHINAHMNEWDLSSIRDHFLSGIIIYQVLMFAPTLCVSV